MTVTGVGCLDRDEIDQVVHTLKGVRELSWAAPKRLNDGIHLVNAEAFSAAHPFRLELGNLCRCEQFVNALDCLSKRQAIIVIEFSAKP